MELRRYWELLRETGRKWLEDKAARLGAALAYYIALSIAPLLVIAIFIAGLVFGKEAAQGQLLDQIRGVVGNQGGQAVETMIAHANKPRTGSFAAVLGGITLLAGATRVVVQLQDVLNTIWVVALRRPVRLPNRPRPGRRPRDGGGPRSARDPSNRGPGGHVRPAGLIAPGPIAHVKSVAFRSSTRTGDFH
jgi:hypothetical protein